MPDVLNESHSMMIVGSEIDDRSERIVKYLSDEYGVNINVATFQYFRTADNDELLARIFLIEPSQVEIRSETRGGSKRRPSLTEEELEQIARENGVEQPYERLAADLTKRFTKGTTLSSLRFFGHISDSNKVIISLLPPKSNREQGLCFQIYLARFMDYAGLDRARAIELLPANKEEWTYQVGGGEDWSGYKGFFSDIDEVERFLEGIQHVVRH